MLMQKLLPGTGSWWVAKTPNLTHLLLRKEKTQLPQNSVQSFLENSLSFLDAS
jgi:hypothetical protein